MRYPKLRELKEALRALLKGPYTSRFPYEPHKPYDSFRGAPHFNQEHCIGCTACFQVCPAGAIEFKDQIISGKARRILSVHWDKCICCGQCQANCPTEKGIVLSQEFDLATTEEHAALFESIEKEAVLCDCCGQMIAPRDQILWVARKLGPLCFSNASLMLFFLSKLGLGLASKEEPKPDHDAEIIRSDRIKVLCPRCRREAVLKS
jgi:formate hydrogenlyase subunit 6/NADH:ubiquinone oxidoreductase subunit I